MMFLSLSKRFYIDSTNLIDFNYFDAVFETKYECFLSVYIISGFSI